MKPHATILLGMAGLISAMSLSSGSAFAQAEFPIGAPDRIGLPCPHPATMKINATPTPSVSKQDFPTALPAAQGVSILGRGGMDQTFRYTFNWKISEKLCCEITRAVLTVRVRWNGSAGPGSNAGNDTISIINNGSSVAGLGGYIWGANAPYAGNVPPSPSTKDIVINLGANASVLAFMNSDHQLSFQVQDDTSVLAATLTLTGCCVRRYK
jgi:hypothetical protein